MWPDELAKSTEATAVVCAALLCAFSRCSLAFFALIFLSFLVPLGWCQCFGRYHTKLPSTTKTWQLQSSKNMMAVAIQPLLYWHHPGFILWATFLTPCHATLACMRMLARTQNWFFQTCIGAASKICENNHWSWQCEPLLQWLHLRQPFSHTSTLAAMLKHCKTCANAMPHLLVAWAWAWASDTASYQSGIQNCSWKLCQ